MGRGKSPLPHSGLFALLLWGVLILPQSGHAGCLSPEVERLQFFEVEALYDGDTVRLVDGRSVRLIGLNTPEMGREQRVEQALAEEAKQRLRALLGHPATIGLYPGEESLDRYRRTLAHTFTTLGEDITATLVGEGLGFVLVIPPNDWNSDCYIEAERQARLNGKGIWGHPDYRPRSLQQLSGGGYQRIRGRVEAVKWSRQWLWLELGHQLSVQIKKRDLRYFNVESLQELQGKSITVQGWLVPRKQGYRMRLHHPSALKVE
ncbi:MAG: thermonuclease family protein [Gammaproteobacteria bacterium]|nr:thermonuclease family protein [Gammaproteobacteria bacterium]MBT7307728.1 thermonuclease family protein [Gammaproteobacteria bacterium]